VNRLIANALLSGFILAVSSPGLSQLSSPIKNSSSSVGRGKDYVLTIKLRVHDYARVPQRILAAATKETTRIFHDGGVELLWIGCPLSSRELSRFPACRHPLGSSGFDVSIVSHSSTALPTLPRTTLGFTPMSKQGERVSLSEVFYDQVKEQTEIVHGSLGRFLGDVMAHEIGHLLLRTSLHSSVGIMRAQWTVEDLRRAARGQLLFTTGEAQIMQAEVSVRGKQEGSPDLAVSALLNGPNRGWAPAVRETLSNRGQESGASGSVSGSSNMFTPRNGH
jgi:hypothetical protein